jgi:hypothetical protein
MPLQPLNMPLSSLADAVSLYISTGRAPKKKEIDVYHAAVQWHLDLALCATEEDDLLQEQLDEEWHILNMRPAYEDVAAVVRQSKAAFWYQFPTVILPALSFRRTIHQDQDQFLTFPVLDYLDSLKNLDQSGKLVSIIKQHPWPLLLLYVERANPAWVADALVPFDSVEHGYFTVRANSDIFLFTATEMAQFLCIQPLDKFALVKFAWLGHEYTYASLRARVTGEESGVGGELHPLLRYLTLFVLVSRKEGPISNQWLGPLLDLKVQTKPIVNVRSLAAVRSRVLGDVEQPYSKLQTMGFERGVTIDWLEPLVKKYLVMR